MDLMYYIVSPFSWLLNFFNGFFSNYGLAIILFALIVKIILFPLTMKGKKSMIQMNMLSGKLDQLKKQYGKDQQRYNLEMQKLYEREKVNPMGGCLWSLLPILILLPLYAIIRQPLKYLMGLTPDQIQQVADALNWSQVALSNGWIREAAAEFTNMGYEQLYLASLITEETLPALAASLGEGVNVFVMNFSFLGIDLASMPTWKIWQNFSWNVVGGFLLVMVSTGLSMLMSKVSMLTNKLNKQSNDQADKTNRTMMWMMPLMSLWIGFSMPAALCVYWIANSLFSMVQEVIAARVLRKDYEEARKASEERARQAKEEEKQRKEQARLERERRAQEEKQNRKKGIKKGGEPEQDGVNKDDSREGLRAYARGRAYIPGRFDGVTEYVDPNTLPPVDKKARKKKEKQTAVAQMTQKVDLTGLNQKKEEPAPAQPEADDNKEGV